MVLHLVCAILLHPVHELKFLFLGNSHTAANDLTGMVKSLIETDGSGRKLTIEVRGAGQLEDFAGRPDVFQLIKSTKWDAIILQGAKQSSSHRYHYSQDGCIQVAKAARAACSNTLLFAEWPRRGWNESEYILGVYREVSDPTGAVIVPICKCWDAALKHEPKLDLWMADGNHSSPTGAYLAACGFYYWFSGGRIAPLWRPPGMSPQVASSLRTYAREAIIHQ